MIEELLPGGVASAEAYGNDMASAGLFPEEEQIVARAVEKRRAEFTAGRACARRALSRLGVPPVPIPRGERGCPRWPAGVVGSITHCPGYRAAAVAPAASVITLGIDAEPHVPLPDGILEMIASPAELIQLRALRRIAPGICWGRLLFSAKESVYKAWFPLSRRWLGFGDAVVTADPAAQTFTARLLVEGPEVSGKRLTCYRGRWLVRQGLVLTAIAVPVAGGTPAGAAAGRLRNPRKGTPAPESPAAFPAAFPRSRVPGRFPLPLTGAAGPAPCGRASA